MDHECCFPVEAGVDVRFADLPMIEGATGKFLLQQMAAVAELEAGMISARTKAALAAAKRRGKRLGNPNLPKAAKRGVAALKANARQFAANVRPIIEEIMRAARRAAECEVGAILHPFDPSVAVAVA
ncbi:MAG TPA: recombinase family protein [Steroidobacteraceae bacterium]|nr:recombinase family protein [Steroidobacteraceae bacterium]